MTLNYALFNHQLVHIDDVKNGLDCQCICPGCGEYLIAKNNGYKKDHHFTHQSESMCTYGFQSMIYMLAKQVINRSKEILVPSLYAKVQDKVTDLLIRNQDKIHISSFVLKRDESKRMIGMLCHGKTYPLWIRFKFYGEDDYDKKFKHETSEDVLEIDISRERHIDILVIDNILTHRLDCKTWVYHHKQNEIEDKLFTYGEEKQVETIEGELSVKDCPLENNDYKKVYTSLMDNCFYCNNYMGFSQNEDKILCLAKANIHSIDQLNSIRTVDKINGLIRSISYKDGKERYFINPLKSNLHTIFDLWDRMGRAFLARNTLSNIAVYIYKNPHRQYAKYGKCYGVMYKNGHKIGNREIYGSDNKQWQLIAEEKENA